MLWQFTEQFILKLWRSTLPKYLGTWHHIPHKQKERKYCTFIHTNDTNQKALRSQDTSISLDKTDSLIEEKSFVMTEIHMWLLLVCHWPAFTTKEKEREKCHHLLSWAGSMWEKKACILLWEDLQGCRPWLGKQVDGGVTCNLLGWFQFFHHRHKGSITLQKSNTLSLDLPSSVI